MNVPTYRSDIAEWLADLVGDVADAVTAVTWRAIAGGAALLLLVWLFVVAAFIFAG